MCVQLLVLLLMCSVRVSVSYSNGSVSLVCDSMLPSHDGFSPQNSTSPYQLLVNYKTYRPGDTITVTLQAVQTGLMFKGFMLQARTVRTGETVGSFSSTNISSTYRLHTCFNLENSTISHASDENKAQFEAMWVSPVTPALGDVMFCATFLKNYTDFWTMVNSDIILSDSSVVYTVSAQVMSVCFLTALIFSVY